MNKTLIDDIKPEVETFLTSYSDLLVTTTKVLMTTTAFNVQNLEDNSADVIINLKKINDIRFVNKFQEAVNEHLPVGGLLQHRVD